MCKIDTLFLSLVSRYYHIEIVSFYLIDTPQHSLIVALYSIFLNLHLFVIYHCFFVHVFSTLRDKIHIDIHCICIILPLCCQYIAGMLNARFIVESIESTHET